MHINPSQVTTGVCSERISAVVSWCIDCLAEALSVSEPLWLGRQTCGLIFESRS